MYCNTSCYSTGFNFQLPFFCHRDVDDRERHHLDMNSGSPMTVACHWNKSLPTVLALHRAGLSSPRLEKKFSWFRCWTPLFEAVETGWVEKKKRQKCRGPLLRYNCSKGLVWSQTIFYSIGFSIKDWSVKVCFLQTCNYFYKALKPPCLLCLGVFE